MLEAIQLKATDSVRRLSSMPLPDGSANVRARLQTSIRGGTIPSIRCIDRLNLQPNAAVFERRLPTLSCLSALRSKGAPTRAHPLQSTVGRLLESGRWERARSWT